MHHPLPTHVYPHAYQHDTMHAGDGPLDESSGLDRHATEALVVRPLQGQAEASNTRVTLRAFGTLGHPNAAFTGPGNASNVGVVTSPAL